MQGRQEWQKHIVTDTIFETPYKLSVYITEHLDEDTVIVAAYYC